MSLQGYIFAFCVGLATGFFLSGTNIVLHTLKNPKTGQWSRKNLTGFTAFIYAMYHAAYGTQSVEAVVGAFLMLTAACFGISAYEKKSILENTNPKSDANVIG